MRYTNWDVLLFPEGSKVPIQEFKTACFAVHDSEYFSQDITSGPNAAFEHGPSRQLPTVTCFVANLYEGAPFRVSLYSWGPPSIISECAQSAAPNISKVCFEARVFIDETCVSGLLFNEQGLWPQVIDKSTYMDKAGNRDCLRFPQFRPEILAHSFWNPGEKVGRIRVVISEIFPPASNVLPFIRLKNLVSFSFQYAPLHMLENSSIAWPNPGMWYQPFQPYYNWATPSPTKVEASEDAELHAHSPRRIGKPTDNMGEKMETNGPSLSSFYNDMPPPPLPKPGNEGDYSTWRLMNLTQDPFIGNNSRCMHMHNRHDATSLSGEDQPPPDYSRSITPASGRNENERTLNTHPNNDHFMNHLNPCSEGINAVTTPANHSRASITHPSIDHSFEEIMNQLNPNSAHSEGTNGVTAPANTRVSSAANTPPLQTRPSATADARVASYPIERPRAVPLTYLPGDQTSTLCGDHVPLRPPRGPASEVKSRKEGNMSELEVPRQMRKRSSNGSIDHKDKENSKSIVTTTIEVSDGKRRRSSTTKGSQTCVHEDEVITSSPTRKVSKQMLKDQSKKVEKASDDTGCLRAPLEVLNNV